MPIFKLGNSGQVGLTELGGFAIKLIADGNLAHGEIVETSDTVDFAVEIAVAGCNHAMGAVYGDEAGADVLDTEDVWIVHYGPADVLMKDGLAVTHGNWAEMSDVNGRGDFTNAAPPGGGVVELDIHMDEIGHCMETKGDGTDVLARIFVHFN